MHQDCDKFSRHMERFTPEHSKNSTPTTIIEDIHVESEPSDYSEECIDENCICQFSKLVNTNYKNADEDLKLDKTLEKEDKPPNVNPREITGLSETISSLLPLDDNDQDPEIEYTSSLIANPTDFVEKKEENIHSSSTKITSSSFQNDVSTLDLSSDIRQTSSLSEISHTTPEIKINSMQSLENESHSFPCTTVAKKRAISYYVSSVKPKPPPEDQQKASPRQYCTCCGNLVTIASHLKNLRFDIHPISLNSYNVIPINSLSDINEVCYKSHCSQIVSTSISSPQNSDLILRGKKRKLSVIDDEEDSHSESKCDKFSKIVTDESKFAGSFVESEQEDDFESDQVSSVTTTSGNSLDSSKSSKCSKSKKRKQKRAKIIQDDDLQEGSKIALEMEKERVMRLQNMELPDVIDQGNIVLEFDDNSPKKPIVALDRRFSAVLKEHQIEGVKFLYRNIIEKASLCYDPAFLGSGCILSHCMGLGKSLQVVSFFKAIWDSPSIPFKRFLIICPLNVLLNWKSEFEYWIDPCSSLKFHIFGEKSMPIVVKKQIVKHWFKHGGVMGISYHTFTRIAYKKNDEGMKETRQFLIEIGPDIVVCDEGHVLKNSKSNLSSAICELPTRRRIVLTGTPMQNNLSEYYVMVNFVKPDLLGSTKEFENRFKNPITRGIGSEASAYDVRLMKRRSHILHSLLNGFIQRKDFTVLESYLPQKFEYVFIVRLTETQAKIYKEFLSHVLNGITTFSGMSRANSLFRDFQVLTLLCAHPHIYFMKKAIKHLNENNYQKLKSNSKELTDPSISPSTGIQSIAAVITDDSDESDIEIISNDLFTGISEMNIDPEKSCKKEDSLAINILRNTEMDIDDCIIDVDNFELDPAPESVIKAPTTEENIPKTVNSTIDNDPICKVFETFIKNEITPEIIELGSKIVILDDMIQLCINGGDKLVVFSQSIPILDFIEKMMSVGGFKTCQGQSWKLGTNYFRMDGSTDSIKRKQQVDKFNDDSDLDGVKLFLISTKAGGIGINLCSANRVVLMDACWNPAHDLQSMFRVYRLGQTKPVYVYRLISFGTMEEKVYERQIMKLSLSKTVVDQHNLERHFSAISAKELYNFDVENVMTFLNKLPPPRFPENSHVNRLVEKHFPRTIIKCFQHDSLLADHPEEKLTQEEINDAWKEYYSNEEVSRPCSELMNDPFVPVCISSVSNRPSNQQSQFVPTKFSSQFTSNILNKSWNGPFGNNFVNSFKFKSNFRNDLPEKRPNTPRSVNSVTKPFSMFQPLRISSLQTLPETVAVDPDEVSEISVESSPPRTISNQYR